MNNTHHQKRSFFYRFRIPYIVVLILVLGGGVLGYYFRYHLLWKYTEWQGDLQGVKSIPNSPMPEAAVPDDWVERSFGSMKIHLPSDLPESIEVAKDDFWFFQNKSRKVVVMSFPVYPENAQLLDLANRFNPASIELTTQTQLRLACFEAGANKFRWSMNPEEARWNSFCIGLRSLFSLPCEFTESIFQKDWEGVVLFNGKHVILSWQSTSGLQHDGCIHFMNLDDKLDFDWMRSVCQSLRIDDSSTTEH